MEKKAGRPADPAKTSKRQIPFRCDPEMEGRLIRARGEWMSKTGQKISTNDFLILLMERGLDSLT